MSEPASQRASQLARSQPTSPTNQSNCFIVDQTNVYNTVIRNALTNHDTFNWLQVGKTQSIRGHCVGPPANHNTSTVEVCHVRQATGWNDRGTYKTCLLSASFLR